MATGSPAREIKKQNKANNKLPGDTTLRNIQPGTLSSVSPGDDKTGHSTGITSNNNFHLPVAPNHESINKNIPEENKINPVNEDINPAQPTDINNSSKTNIENEASAATQTVQQKKTDTVQKINDSIKNTQQAFSKNIADKNSKQVKFHYGLQWNINFSLKNNSHYFDGYDNNKQYYMWALPAAWAKMDINKKHGIMFRFNPFSQQFAGKQVLNIEKPFIASIEPDSVTSLIKSRGYNFGLNYEYNINSKITFVAGLSYTIQHNALYLQQAVEGYSGNILSEGIYAAGKKDASFKYLNPSYLSWNGSVKYNFRKLSIGAGVTRPISDLSSNPDYTVRPLNGEFYLQYHFK